MNAQQLKKITQEAKDKKTIDGLIKECELNAQKGLNFCNVNSELDKDTKKELLNRGFTVNTFSGGYTITW